MNHPTPLRAFLGAAPIVGLAALTGFQAAQDSAPREFGDVQWSQRLERALEISSKDGKPVLLLFQEVPG